MKCCFIGCEKQATKGIYGKLPYSDSYACDEHVDLLIDESDTVMDIKIDG